MRGSRSAYQNRESPINRSLLFKLGAIALLILLLLIPLLMINGIISDRQQLRDGVLMDIARSSSYSQRLTGPVMVVPATYQGRPWALVWAVRLAPGA